MQPVLRQTAFQAAVPHVPAAQVALTTGLSGSVNVPPLYVQPELVRSGYRLFGTAVQMTALFAGIAVKPGVVSSEHIASAAGILDNEPFPEATLAFCLALLNATKIIAARMPMMAMTTRSSIKVKPFRFIHLLLIMIFYYFLKTNRPMIFHAKLR